MPSNDPDIRHEPHLRPQALQSGLDPAVDAPLGFDARPVPFSQHSEEDIDHSVWDEPSLTPDVAGKVPKSALTYANWLTQRRENWTQLNAWTVTLGVILLSCPMATIAAFVSWVSGNMFIASDLIVVCVLGPMLQEILKIAVPLWIVEKRPYFFTTWFQFFILGLVSALVFAAVSNFFLSLMVEEITQSFFLFQWVGVLGLNLVTAAIAAWGLETIWRNSINQGKPPRLEHGYPYFATAIGIHVAFATGSALWFLVSDFDRLLTL